MPTPKRTIVICPIDTATIEKAKQKGCKEAVVKALECLKGCLEKVSGPGRKRQERLFVTEAVLTRFLRKKLGASEAVHISNLKQIVESQLALLLEIPRAEDFTFFLDRIGAAEAALREHPDDDPVESLLRGAKARKVFADVLSVEQENYYEGAMWLWDQKAKRAASGRAIACSCERGAKWSVTFRRQYEYPKRKRQQEFFNSLDDVSEILSRTIFETEDTDMRGLIVVAGRTGSGKSQIARGLIGNYFRILAKRPDGGRVPHLLTFEDPIEKRFTQQEIGRADCTQREKPKDVRDLVEAMRNALRQTPKVVFAGETREPQEWTQLLEFAGTGHLVITTTHAGSLVEAMGNILKETESRTPAARAVVADRLLAVVHIKSETQTGTSFLIPAMWHRTPIGIKALMAEGLSSMLPNTPPALDSDKRIKTHLPGSVGRYWFARELVKKTSHSNLGTLVKERAIEWDLEGI